MFGENVEFCAVVGTVIGDTVMFRAKREEIFKVFRYYYRGYCYVSREARRKFYGIRVLLRRILL